MAGSQNLIADFAENQSSDIVVPRLDLDLSGDNSEFAELNELYSENHIKDVEATAYNVRSVFTSKKRRRKYIVDGQDVIGLLAKEGMKKKQEASLVEFNGDLCTMKNSAGQVIVEVDANDRPGIKLLQHLHILKEFRLMKGRSAMGLTSVNEEITEIYCFRERKWWQSRNRLTKKDLLMVSIKGLEAYRCLLNEKISEVKGISSMLARNNEVNSSLRGKMKEDQEDHERIVAEYDSENQRNQEQLADEQRKSISLRKDKQDLKFKVAELLGRIKNDEIKKRDMETEELAKMKKGLIEERKTILGMNETISNQTLELQKMELNSKQEVAELQEELKKQNEENKELKSKINGLIGTSQETSNVSSLDQFSEFYDFKMAKEIQMSAIFVERDQIKEELIKAKKIIENLKSTNSSPDTSPKNHEHFVDSVCCEGSKFDLKENKEKNCRDYAVLKLDDLWAEQMACHQSSLHKLKEMQNLRLELINNRQQLEKAINENDILKNTMKNKEELKEMHWKATIKETTTELKTKDEELDRLRSALHEQSSKSAEFSKQLKQSLAMQRTKEDEIYILNAAVKQEDNKEYCVVTAESMCNFKNHVRSLKDENRLLSNESDRVENQLNVAEKKVHSLKKKNAELYEKNEVLEERCKELEADSEIRDNVLKQLKENHRSLTNQHDNIIEDLKDRTYELIAVKARLEKAQTRLTEVDHENQVLKEDNCMTSRNYNTVSRELRESSEELKQLQLRYANVEQTYKKHETEMGDLSMKLNNRDATIQKLESSIKEKNSSLIETQDQIKEMQSGQEEELIRLQKEAKTSTKELENVQWKLEQANKEIEENEAEFSTKNAESQKENENLMAEIKELVEELRKQKLTNNDDQIKELQKGQQEELIKFQKDSMRCKELVTQVELLQEDIETLNAELAETKQKYSDIAASSKQVMRSNQPQQKPIQQGDFPEMGTKQNTAKDFKASNDEKSKKRSTDLAWLMDDESSLNRSYTPEFDKSQTQRKSRTDKPSWLLDNSSSNTKKNESFSQRGSNQGKIQDDSLDIFGFESNKNNNSSSLDENMRNRNGTRNSSNQRVSFLDDNLKKGPAPINENEEDSLNFFCLEKSSKRRRPRGSRSDADAAEELRRLVDY